MTLSWQRFTLSFSGGPKIMGIVNVTPDSFSDGGRYFGKKEAVDHAVRLEQEGADILDIGGESTRPGSEPVSEDEELRRTIPVIEELAGVVSIPISIDTYKSGVAKKALEAGASIVNDISGLRFDPEMAATVAASGVPVIVMHMQGQPRTMQTNPHYAALIPEITSFFRKQIAFAVRSGIPEGLVILDPGIGFGKTFLHNIGILRNLETFKHLGRPLAVGVSRKAFIGKLAGDAPPDERIFGTAAAVAIAAYNGASILRVHDVREMTQVLKIAHAIAQAPRQGSQ